jgi:hypothetical protein
MIIWNQILCTLGMSQDGSQASSGSIFSDTPGISGVLICLTMAWRSLRKIESSAITLGCGKI